MNRQLLLVLLVAASSATQAQIRQASEAELDVIRDELRLDGLPEPYVVLEYHGSVLEQTDTQGEEWLVGGVTFQAYPVQGDLCVMERWTVNGRRTANGYAWESFRTSYRNWLRQEGESCDVADQSALPNGVVVTEQEIPSATLSYIMKKEVEILALGYEFADASDASIEMSEQDPERFLRFQNDPLYRLTRIEIARRSIPEIGVAYTATYASPQSSAGPIVVFSVTPTGFVVHYVGFWVA